MTDPKPVTITSTVTHVLQAADLEAIGASFPEGSTLADMEQATGHLVLGKDTIGVAAEAASVAALDALLPPGCTFAGLPSAVTTSVTDLDL